MEKFLAITIIYVITVNLFGAAWSWFKHDIWVGWNIAVIGGSGVGIVALGLELAIYLLMNPL